MFLDYYIYFLVFFFGAVVGSFLNVVILRYGTGQSVAFGGSKCFNCAKKLRWHELFPVISFLALRGKCSACKSRISWQYPIVEAITGLLFLLVFRFKISGPFDFSATDLLLILYFGAIFSCLIVIAVYDYHHQVIPDLFVWIFNGLAFLGLFNFLNFQNLNLFRVSDLTSWIFNWNSFLAGIYLFAFFALLWLISRGKWMGFGDVKLVLGIGWFLGIYKGIAAITLSFWIGAAVGIFLLLAKKERYNVKSGIAFGPFMALGAGISFFWGEKIIKIIFGA